jgi:SM-20-related protein
MAILNHRSYYWPMTSLTIAHHLGRTGLCVCPDFLSARQLENMRNNLNEIHGAGNFKRASIGHSREAHDAIRSDEIHWLERGDLNTAQIALWRKIDRLIKVFNRTLFLGLRDFEGHYAIYPKGGLYARHLDRFRDDGDRMVSFILYLNRDWKIQDGGKLRVFNEAGHTDIDPRGGTMVCFLSGESEHEVLLNHTPRFSFSGWFKTR